MVYSDPYYVETHLSAFFGTKTEDEEDLFCDIKVKVYFEIISDQNRSDPNKFDLDNIIYRINK